MDYISYVNQRVGNTETRERILSDVLYFQKRWGEDWLPNFINNFHWMLPHLRMGIEYRIERGELDTKKRFRDYRCYEDASEKFKEQNFEGFLMDIDEAVQRLGISPEELKTRIAKDIKTRSKTAGDDIFRIMVELMSWGYFRHPDLQ